ncbi:macro domain-containing protein [Hydrogenophaga sp. 2FB]|uniref:macro domain-containing protein n=1 Tax=Hydrogenophaga sp. 2FB TaxID=2502187 RepID=UPI00207BCF7F|nr:macro domain-containing protein [Hydrogenophaga sp. 2FB]
MLLFVDIPSNCKMRAGIAYLVVLALIHLFTWLRANSLREITIDIEGSEINIITGNIFKQKGLKAIAFNEYFDTQVDNVIISKESLNGKFIELELKDSVEALDAHIANFSFDDGDIVEAGAQRHIGKKTRYRLGTICVYNDFLLTAFARFDTKNRANLTMPEYLEFLINFWDKVNKIYAQQSVSTTIFGSGITRIKGHRTISDEDLLKIMLWTFRISEMRFKYPAKLTVVIHESKIDQINLLDIASVKNGV